MEIEITDLRMSRGNESEVSNVLRIERDMETARAQLHEDIGLLDIMSARTCLDLLNLATMGDAVRMTSQKSAEEVTVARLRSLDVEIEKAKASIRELRREILKAKRERIEDRDGLDGYAESRQAVQKQEGSSSRGKRPGMFNGVIVGIAALAIVLCILGVRTRGDNNRK